MDQLPGAVDVLPLEPKQIKTTERSGSLTHGVYSIRQWFSKHGRFRREVLRLRNQHPLRHGDGLGESSGRCIPKTSRRSQRFVPPRAQARQCTQCTRAWAMTPLPCAQLLVGLRVSSTHPQNSCPMMSGGVRRGLRARNVSSSEPQMPQLETRTSTSPSCSTGLGPDPTFPIRDRKEPSSHGLVCCAAPRGLQEEQGLTFLFTHACKPFTSA